MEAENFIIVFTKARHWSLPWARRNYCAPSHPTFPRSILISSYIRLTLSSGLFPSDFIIFIIISFLQGWGQRPVPVQNFNFWTYESIWTFGRTPWTGDQPDARPLPTQDNTTQKKTRTHTHSPSRIRSCDPNVRTAEDSTCLRPRGHWDRLLQIYRLKFLKRSTKYFSNFCLEGRMRCHARNFHEISLYHGRVLKPRLLEYEGMLTATTC
jgi:hypothetical protein